jgi:CRISPR-associated protein Cas1
LSHATASLYGVVHAVIVALGCSPGLGLVHTGHVRSFVFDIADLYKAEIAVPVAFDVAARDPEDLEGETRRAMRDAMHAAGLTERCARDVRMLLTLDSTTDDSTCEEDGDVVMLWDGGQRRVAAGRSYVDPEGVEDW